MSLLRFVASMTLDNTNFMAGLKQAESGSVALGNKLATVFGTAAVIAYAREVIGLAGNIKDLSEQFGLTTDSVQELQKVAADAGTKFEQYGQILIKIKKAQADFNDGDKTAKSLFKRLGIDPDQSAYEILKQIGYARDMAAVYELVGVKSGRLVDSLKEIKRLGPMEIISNEDIEKLDKADKTIARVLLKAKQIFALTLGQDIQTLEDIKNAITNPREKIFGAIANRLADPLGNEQPGMKATMGSKRMAEEESMYKGMDWASDKEFVNGAWRTKQKPETSKSIAQKQSFQALPSDELARIGGSFGPGSGLGSIEREQLAVAKRMDQRLGVIESKIVSVPTEGTE
jgi:hypothetical protein